MMMQLGFVVSADELPSIEFAVGEELDVGIDYAKLLETGETIDSSVWAVDAGVSPGASTIIGTVSVLWLSFLASAPGSYTLTNTITTSGVAGGPPRRYVRSFVINLVALR